MEEFFQSSSTKRQPQPQRAILVRSCLLGGLSSGIFPTSPGKGQFELFCNADSVIAWNVALQEWISSKRYTEDTSKLPSSYACTLDVRFKVPKFQGSEANIIAWWRGQLGGLPSRDENRGWLYTISHTIPDFHPATWFVAASRHQKRKRLCHAWPRFCHMEV